MYKGQSRQRVLTCQVGTLVPTHSLEGLRDLLQALQPELEASQGLISLWGNELQRELTESLSR